MEQVGVISTEVAKLPQYVAGNDATFVENVDHLLVRLDALMSQLASLVIVGIQHDVDGKYTDLWVRCLQRLLQAPAKVDGTFQEKLVALRRYPALIFLRAAGITCLQFDREDVLLQLLTKPTWREPYNDRSEVIAGRALNDYRVVDGDLVNALPRYTNGWLYPPSHLIREVTREMLREPAPDDEQYQRAHDDFEFRMALVQEHPEDTSSWRMPGEYLLDGRWSGEVPSAEKRFREKADQSSDDWPWLRYLGGRDNVDPVLLSLRENLKRMRRWH